MSRVKLTPMQCAVARMYCGGEFSHVESMAEAKRVGDTLFVFLLAEAGDAGDDLDEMLRMIDTARDQLGELALDLSVLGIHTIEETK